MKGRGEKYTEGEMVAIRNVREFPPMESWSSLVSLDSLGKDQKGMGRRTDR
jgi:hypothetical protein